MGLPRWHSGKESTKTENAGYSGSIPGLGSPRSRKWQPTPVFLSGKPHVQRSLLGYSPWDHKELDITVHTHTHPPKPWLRDLVSPLLPLDTINPYCCIHSVPLPITSWSFMWLLYSFLCGLECYLLLSLPQPSPGFQGNHPRQNANKY